MSERKKKKIREAQNVYRQKLISEIQLLDLAKEETIYKSSEKGILLYASQFYDVGGYYGFVLAALSALERAKTRRISILEYLTKTNIVRSSTESYVQLRNKSFLI